MKEKPNNFNGKYEQIKLLGEGSFGKAFLVESIDDKSLSVIKTIDLVSMSEEEKKEAIQEAKILEQLNHPNIIKFKEVFVEKKTKLNIVMDYADGGDLQQKIKSMKHNKHFPESQILDWFTQTCLAIKHIHDRKILHRDVKSQNIFLTKNGLVKMGDFGIAKCLDLTIDKVKTIVGTPYYLSPELLSNKPYSFKNDIWALGVLLYEMSALRMPFEAPNLPLLSLKILKCQYTPVPDKYSKELRMLISVCLNVDPNRRPSVKDILNLPIIQGRINRFLSEVEFNDEFSHTIMHKYNPMKTPSTVESYIHNSNGSRIRPIIRKEEKEKEKERKYEIYNMKDKEKEREREKERDKEIKDYKDNVNINYIKESQGYVPKEIVSPINNNLNIKRRDLIIKEANSNKKPQIISQVRQSSEIIKYEKRKEKEKIEKSDKVDKQINSNIGNGPSNINKSNENLYKKKDLLKRESNNSGKRSDSRGSGAEEEKLNECIKYLREVVNKAKQGVIIQYNNEGVTSGVVQSNRNNTNSNDLIISNDKDREIPFISKPLLSYENEKNKNFKMKLEKESVEAINMCQIMYNLKNKKEEDEYFEGEEDKNQEDLDTDSLVREFEAINQIDTETETKYETETQIENNNETSFDGNQNNNLIVEFDCEGMRSRIIKLIGKEAFNLVYFVLKKCCFEESFDYICNEIKNEVDIKKRSFQELEKYSDLKMINLLYNRIPDVFSVVLCDMN